MMNRIIRRLFFASICTCIFYSSSNGQNNIVKESTESFERQRISLNAGWKFMRYSSGGDSLVYERRPAVANRNDNIVADTRATQSAVEIVSEKVLKNWILPSGNDFIKDSLKQHRRPAGNPGADFEFVQNNFNDDKWESVNLPHDWSINEPFYKGDNAIVGGGMGRLPIQGVAWYRKKLSIGSADRNKFIYLDIDGAMSYAMVWLNGKLVGGWPYGYNSFRLDLTPFINFGGRNQLSIRLDNPTNSSRWYPGAGIYRNVWLTKLNQVHVAQWGTFVTTKNISAASATINLSVEIENKSAAAQAVELLTDIYLLNDKMARAGKRLAAFPSASIIVSPGKKKIESVVELDNPRLWQPLPELKPYLYSAVTHVYQDKKLIDVYATTFGIRSLDFSADRGLLVNGTPMRIQGVNQHHDLGALGAAFNVRAAERQLEILREMGCNAIRLAHNPPAPELLDLTDRMGFLVIDEIFDCWEKGKTPLDFHLIFKDWHEPDTRSFIRRDRNHPSIIAWSFGNEVGEQYSGEEGAVIAKELHDIVREEDSTRPATASMNYAKPDMPFPKHTDILSLNYQGEGIRDAPAYQHLKGIRTSPLYPAFHKNFAGKLIVSSETSSALSTRGTYIFPVVNGSSAPVEERIGGDSSRKAVSAYELYTAAFGASPDKVFATQDQFPYVAGEFVWSGFDYLGEPTPYYSARSSYSGIIDLAGFKKDRFYLYQSRWRSDLQMAHILPHWTWPENSNLTIPVHVFSSGDEAELFINDKSLGRKRKSLYEYRFRWDSVRFIPGVLKVVCYKKGAIWATDSVVTAGTAAKLKLVADKKRMDADGKDLCFITVQVLDKKGLPVAMADNLIKFRVTGAAEMIATDNGDPSDLRSFNSSERNAFSGMALLIIRSKRRNEGVIKITAESIGLSVGELEVYAGNGK